MYGEWMVKDDWIKELELDDNMLQSCIDNAFAPGLDMRWSLEHMNGLTLPLRLGWMIGCSLDWIDGYTLAPGSRLEVGSLELADMDFVFPLLQMNEKYLDFQSDSDMTWAVIVI